MVRNEMPIMKTAESIKLNAIINYHIDIIIYLWICITLARKLNIACYSRLENSKPFECVDCKTSVQSFFLEIRFQRCQPEIGLFLNAFLPEHTYKGGCYMNSKMFNVTIITMIMMVFSCFLYPSVKQLYASPSIMSCDPQYIKIIDDINNFARYFLNM